MDRMMYNNKLRRDLQGDNENKTKKILERVNN